MDTTSPDGGKVTQLSSQGSELTLARLPEKKRLKLGERTFRQAGNRNFSDSVDM
jgi:hypothetical protein